MKVRHRVITVGWNRHRHPLKPLQHRHLSRQSVVLQRLSQHNPLRDRLRVYQYHHRLHPRHSAVSKHLSHRKNEQHRHRHDQLRACRYHHRLHPRHSVVLKRLSHRSTQRQRRRDRLKVRRHRHPLPLRRSDVWKRLSHLNSHRHHRRRDRLRVR